VYNFVTQPVTLTSHSIQNNTNKDNNNNAQDNVYGAEFMAQPLREFTQFI